MSFGDRRKRLFLLTVNVYDGPLFLPLFLLPPGPKRLSMSRSAISRISALIVALSLFGCGGGGNSDGGGGNGNPPAAPGGIVSTSGDAQVSLSWNASAGATSYHVKRSTTAGGPYTTVGSPTGTSYTDTGVTNGSTYYYVVSAVNDHGESGNSGEVKGQPTSAPPAAPTGVVATPGDKQVRLAWNASAGAASYNVKRSTSAGGPYSTIGSPTTTNFTDTGLSNGTTYYYVISGVNARGEGPNCSEVNAKPAGSPPADVTVTVNPGSTRPISPWIYGINFYGGVPNAPHATMDRAGGNRWTAYNWENNFSNAGSDYGPYHNDNFLCNGSCNQAMPGEGVRTFVAADHAAGIASLITVQLQGLVSADGNGNVDVSHPPDMTRFKTVVDKKSTVDPTPFTLNPPTNDANVYMDEFLLALDEKFSAQNIFGTNPSIQPTFVSFDNEPELWNSTHLEVQGPTPITSDAYITKTISLAKALKDQFPDLVIFAPVHYGFAGIYSWQGELSPTPTGSNWFPDKYLQAVATASNTYGRPLVDVYDFHWYPEVYNTAGTRIIAMSSNTLTDSDVQQIVQAPRDLWDPTWHDPSNSNPWVYQTLGSTPIQILPRLQAKIDAEFPIMKGLAITEYEGGGWNHIAGTIAQADMLGVFGTQGLFAASMWPPGGTYDYALAGFRAFRGFDGANANFGDTSVQATSSDLSKVAVYASTDTSAPGRVVFVAINRTKSSLMTAINGIPLSGTAKIYQITAASAAGQNPIHPVPVGTQAANGTSVNVTLPALSVTTIEVR